MEANVKNLIEKADKADNPDAAMKYAQAALNAANAIIGLENMKKQR